MNIVMKRDKIYESYRLKPIEIVMEENPEGWLAVGIGTYRNKIMRWTINPNMLKRFGDGHKRWYSLIQKKVNGNYTHVCQKAHYWHESWFEKDAILEFEDNEFEL